MPRIIIVGGGPAGIACAQTLASKLTAKDDTEVLVLEKSKYYYHAVGVPRAYVEADFTKKLFIPYDDAIPQAAKAFVRVVRAVATRISAEESEVSFHTIGDDDQESKVAEKLHFDYLVLATGSTYVSPIKQAGDDYARIDTEAKLHAVRNHIEKAQKILVVGGGSVGCEVAGEIKSKHPDKHVTILEARSKLLASNKLSDKLHSYLDYSLDKLQVEVILGERLGQRLEGNCFEKRTLRTDKGTEIESDIQLLCGGFRPATQLVHDMDASLVTEGGAIKVNDQLQLEGEQYAHMFALGDASNHATPKMAFTAGEQGKHLAHELAGVLHQKQDGFQKPFSGMATPMIVLPLGSRGGVSQLPVWGGIVFGDWVTWLLKSRDMFASKTWYSLGATMPS